ncbi:MAG: PIG-L family deacetylase [candidate division KSB1 bacterium]|nr:PIG-L family deacetylase [candidate division KSB1 bacterium]MDZ7365251.1 PIG-L family deacetylase [candidate division KSB1 bacterium]MDZ7403118.1 PIG-L family deacetylase [candidate division KSB1 bacterium]
MRKNFFHPRLSIFLPSLIALALFYACAKKPSSQNYFPEVGRNALVQRSLEARSNLKVLSVSLRPGDEDFAALAYFRLGRGAVVMSVYVTNGEGGESDVQGEYPPYLAVTRRREAVAAMNYLNSDVRFLNLPDIVAARDSAQVRQLWPGDSLRFKLNQFISQFRPDLILLNRDWSAPSSSSWQVLLADLLAAVQSAASVSDTDFANGASGNWTISRVAVDLGGEGLVIPTHEKPRQWNKSYREIGEEAANAYTSLAVQQKWRREGRTPAYAIVHPPRTPALQRLDEGLPAPVPPPLRGIEIQIEALTDKTLEGQTRDALPRVAALIDSIEYTLAINQLTLTARERKSLLQWKNALENLRCTLLGVEVDYAVSDTLLTDAQLTYIVVNEVKGLSKDGKTEILFAGIDQQWAVNEDVPKKMPLVLKDEYRLLTPKGLTYNFAPAQYPFQLTPNAKSVFMFIIHQAKSKAQSFVYRRLINLDFAPKFVVEVLTPIVRMVPDERVVIRMMNISRDGVADTVEVVDSLAYSFRHPFRLSYKGATKIDTLTLAWRRNPPDGTYMIPVEIDGIPVAHFAARKFSVEIDRAKRVGLLTGLKNSPTAEALRRLNMNFALVKPDQSFMQQIEPLSVLVIDRRALTLRPEIAARRDELQRFVESGGHLIVLAQDAEKWNAQPLWEGMRLTAVSTLEPATPVQIDAAGAIGNQPNHLTPEDWQNWLFLRGYNAIAVGEAAVVPLRSAVDGSPLIVTAAAGQGKRTYVDLALNPQLMNVHAGAFRLLANLISL